MNGSDLCSVFRRVKQMRVTIEELRDVFGCQKRIRQEEVMSSGCGVERAKGGDRVRQVIPWSRVMRIQREIKR